VPSVKFIISNVLLFYILTLPLQLNFFLNRSTHYLVLTRHVTSYISAIIVQVIYFLLSTQQHFPHSIHFFVIIILYHCLCLLNRIIPILLMILLSGRLILLILLRHLSKFTVIAKHLQWIAQLLIEVQLWFIILLLHLELREVKLWSLQWNYCLLIHIIQIRVVGQ
jgi:hypothetical protein